MRGLCAAVLMGLAAAANAAAAGPHAVALMYHHVGDGEYPSTNVTVEQFRRHLDYLANHGYHVLPLARIVNAIRGGQPLPDHAVAITFDDAYASVFETAYPLLRRRGWPFTVFVSTHVVGGGNFMTWAQMRQMAAHGATFANHSDTHDHLIRRRPGESAEAWRKRVSGDIQKAQTLLERHLGDSVADAPKMLAYPFGEYNAALADWAAGAGYVAFGQESGALGPHTDWRAAPRYPINEHYAAMDSFTTKVESLPLHVTQEEPFDPVVQSENPPALEVTLASRPAHWKQLSCYLGGRRIPVAWVSRRRFRVQPGQPLSVGRSRYNCTVPADGRYRWYSHPWIVPERELRQTSAPADPASGKADAE